MTQACNTLSEADGRSGVGVVPCDDLQQLLDPRLFRALSDPNRLALLSQLAGSPESLTVSELDTCCSVDVSVVSRHLAVLREAGVLTAEKRGRKVFYSICCEPLAQFLRSVAEALECCAANGCRPASPSKETRA